MISKLSSPKDITLKKIKESLTKKPRRICFNTIHSNCFNTVDDTKNTAISALNLPFNESIEVFINREINLKLIKYNKERFWCPANTNEEHNSIQKFFDKYNNIVFIRDTLDCSISLSEHMIDEERRTELGQLEYEAKYLKNTDAVDEISEQLYNFINNSFYKETDIICSIPPSKKEKESLPNVLAQLVAEKLGICNISPHISWKKDKESLKELNVEEKLDTLIKIDMDISYDFKDKNVILIDDLYQSGITMQYVAMKLKEAGAKKVFGITIVKSRKDTDNL